MEAPKDDDEEEKEVVVEAKNNNNQDEDDENCGGSRRKATFCKEVSAFVCCIAVPFRSYDTTSDQIHSLSDTSIYQGFDGDCRVAIRLA